MAAVGAVGALFELSELDAAAIGVAELAYERMRNPFGSSKRARVTGNSDNRALKNVLPGGVGHYKGDFKKRRVDVSESALTQYGYRQEQEVYGTLSMNDCQYLTVQSANMHMMARAIGHALARMIMKKHFGVTYSSASDLLFPGTPVSATTATDWNQIWFILKTRSSDGTETLTQQPVISGGITSLTTLDDFVGGIVTLLVTAGVGSPALYSADYTQFHAYQIVYGSSATGSATATGFSLSPRYVIDQDLIRISVLQIINLQNVTRADNAGATAGGTRDAIDANPIVGKVFHMQGIYPNVENQAGNLTAATNFALRLMKFVPPHATGIGVPDINPVGEWRGVPHPQVFANILSCRSGLRLEPGEIKKDVLRFSFFGTLNDLCRGFSYLQNSAVGTNEPQPVYASDKMGTCKLYAFEKVVPTGADSIEMNYHIDRYITAQMYPNCPQNSSRGEFTSTKYDLKQGTQPVALADVPVVLPADHDVDIDVVLP